MLLFLNLTDFGLLCLYFFLKIHFIFIVVHVFACALGDQRRISGPLGLYVQVLLSLQHGRCEVRPSGIAAMTLNHQGPMSQFLFQNCLSFLPHPLFHPTFLFFFIPHLPLSIIYFYSRQEFGIELIQSGPRTCDPSAPVSRVPGFQAYATHLILQFTVYFFLDSLVLQKSYAA